MHGMTTTNYLRNLLTAVVCMLTALSAQAQSTTPEPELLLSKLNIVSELTHDINQKVRTDYNADKVEIDIKEALTTLGFDDLAMVQENLKDLLYVGQIYVNPDDVALGEMKHDSLTNETSANGIGFWLKRYESQDGQPNFECVRAPYGGSDFYAELFEFDAETGILSCNVGQMPNTLEGDNTYYVFFYIINGDKAISIRLNLNIEASHIGTLEEMEKAGESTVEIEMQPMTDYSTKSFEVDTEAIATALGCTAADLDDFYALKDEITFGDKNQEGVGYWFNAEGFIQNWGDYANFYITPLAEDYTRFGLGQYPGHLNVGDEQTTSIFFINGTKYYQLSVHLTIVEPKSVEGEFQNMATRTINIQQEPAGYTWSNGVDIPQTWIADNIGTQDWVLYGLAVLDEEGNEPEGNARYVKDYTMAEAPGFWLNAEGRNSGHGDKSVFGLSVGNAKPGQISMIQMPDLCSVGDVYKTQVFFVNEETGAMVTLNLVYSIVDEVVDYETVGTESIVLPLADKDIFTAIDLTKAAEALGVSVDDLLNDDNKYLHGITDSGIFGGGFSAADGIVYNEQGFFDLANGSIILTIGQEGDNVTAATYSNDAIADDYSLSTQMCFRIDNKQYVFDVKFISAAAYATAVTAVKRSQPMSGTAYDLNGRKIENRKSVNRKLVRGLYIIDGKKTLVK